MKKLFRLLLCFLLVGMFLGMGGFLVLGLYYRSNFPVNTWINGVYCTGKTVEQVNGELADSQEASAVSVIDIDHNVWEIDMDAADIRPDYIPELKAYLKRSSYISWLENLGGPVSVELPVERYSADKDRLASCFGKLPFVEEERDRTEGVSVLWSEEGYYLQDNNGKRLIIAKALDYLEDCLSKGQTTVDLAEGECYEDLPDSDDDRIQRDIWKQICEFTDRAGTIVYDMGTEKIGFSPAVAGGFLEKGSKDACPTLDGQNRITVSEEAVRKWVEQLAGDYDTCGTQRAFEATRGDIVMVDYETYGTQIDVEAETAYLMKALRTGSEGKEVHIPAYLQEGYVRGLDDIGDTYIEIDMTEQKMYYYEDGEISLETDIVTGNLRRKMGTPEGINYVYAKQRNRYLRGPGYVSFVKYWMPVNGSIGIHDASWRSAYGGEIYKTDGSHGCVNTPGKIMSQLYEKAEVGTPVIMFY